MPPPHAATPARSAAQPAAARNTSIASISAHLIARSRSAAERCCPALTPFPLGVGKEVLDRGDQEVRLVFRDEGATVGDQLESALRQQSCQPSSMLAGEDGHKTVGAALRYQHSQDGSAVGLPREQSPGDAEDRYQGNEGERDAEVKESARRVPTRLHHHQVRLMAERVEERKRDARADQRE